MKDKPVQPRNNPCLRVSPARFALTPATKTHNDRGSANTDLSTVMDHFAKFNDMCVAKAETCKSHQSWKLIEKVTDEEKRLMK